MKRQYQIHKITMAVLAVVLAVTVSGCGKSAGQENPAEDKAQATVAATEGTTPEVTATPEIAASAEPELVEMTVYYGDDDCESLLQKTVEVTQVEETVILSELEKAGVLQEGIELRDVQRKEKKGKTVLYLDFNQAFQQQLASYGSAGEQIFMGAVVNTFLDAMSADQVRVTVEGVAPETGHDIYDSPMEKFDLSE